MLSVVGERKEGKARNSGTDRAATAAPKIGHTEILSFSFSQNQQCGDASSITVIHSAPSIALCNPVGQTTRVYMYKQRLLLIG